MSLANNVAAATQSIGSPGTNAGAAAGSAPAPDRKAGDMETAPQFGEILQRIQSKFGAHPEKPREVKKTLGKDDFLRIMITQMKNQDPTNPFKAEQMAAEMAQFTTVEQLKNMNESLGKMSTANQPLERMAMTGMIGKTVTVDRGRFPHTEGAAETVSFGLPAEAANCKVSLIDDHGETVLEKDMGKLKGGENVFSWDGNKTNTLPARTGNYMIRVEAVDARGAKLETDSLAQARVIGVSFEGAEPVFLIGDNRHQEKVTMKNIVRIDDNGGGVQVASARPAPGGGIQSLSALGKPHAPPAFFTFQKGVGSSNLDPTQAPPEVLKALGEKGFPNGLGDANAPQANAAAPGGNVDNSSSNMKGGENK